MAKIQHPWQVGPTELIEFALERLHRGSDVDRRLGFLILDVGVETLFKTYLTLPSSVMQFQINRMDRDAAVKGNFHDLLHGVQKSNPERASKFNFAHIEHYHRLRNMLYHEGNQVTAVPMHQLEGYAKLAVSLLKTYLDVDLSKELKPAKKILQPVASTAGTMPTDQNKMLALHTGSGERFQIYPGNSSSTGTYHLLGKGRLFYPCPSTGCKRPGNNNVLLSARSVSTVFCSSPVSGRKDFSSPQGNTGNGIFQAGTQDINLVSKG